MIIVDLEMSGTDSKKCGIIEIGAVDFDNPKNQFNQIAKLSNDEIVYNDPTCSKPVLEVLGKTEEELRNPKLKSQKQLLENFFKWTKSCKDKVLACQQCLDIQFLRAKCKKYKLKFLIQDI
jgi:DNA polymerase III epsilon subunit-like protein